VPHGFVALLDILVVALDGVIIVLQPVPPACNRHSPRELRYPVEVAVKSPSILSELVGNKSREPPLFCWFVFFPRENLAYPLSDALFQLPEEFVKFIESPA
jgi:hypothetical protein